MQFNEKEIRFVMTPNPSENSITGNRTSAETADLRLIGAPTRLFERLLERRAKKLGNKFVEFRAQNQYSTSSQPDLSDRISAAKLF